MKSKTVFIAITITLCLIIAGLGYYLYRQQLDFQILANKHASLQQDYGALEKRHTSLESEYNSLTSEFSTLRSEHDALVSEHDSLKREYASLESRYTTLESQYQNLQSSYDKLNSQYTELRFDLGVWEQLHIGTTLETYYDYVRANVITIGGHPLGEEEWWSYPDYYDLSVEFAAHEAAHDAGNLYWPSLEDESDYYEHTGEYSCDTARRILQEVLHLGEVNPYDSSSTKIDKIMKFIRSLIRYETRLIDHMWFPTETLVFRSGDCTSFSILEAALFETAGIKSAIGFFKNDKREYHAMILVHLEELGGHGYYYFKDLTSYGLTVGQWIIIDPQYHSLSEQEAKQEDWIPQWDILVACEVDYGP